MKDITFQMDLAPLNAPVDAGTELFVPEGVCPKQIHFSVDKDKLARVSFSGGCDGNLKAMSTLIEGMKLSEVVEKLSGITCGSKPTSCADQLCLALREYMDED